MADKLPLKTRGELWLAAWMRRYYQLRQRTLETAPAQRFTRYDIGAASPADTGAAPRSGTIPRIIWAYWNGPQPPLLIQRCFDNWARLNPGYSIRILNDASLPQYLPDLPQTVHALTVAKRSDWVRLELLHRHGGIWLDASTILTESLDWVLEQQQRTQADLVGYYLDRYTSDPACPVVESWFMAAPPASAFIRDLQREFAGEVVGRSGEQYIEHLRARGDYERLRQNIDIPAYLSIHLAMQATLRSGGSYRLCLARAEDGPFFLHVKGDWRRAPLKIRLMFSRAARAPAPLVKLRAPDRKKLDLYLERGLYVPGSIADRYLPP